MRVFIRRTVWLRLAAFVVAALPVFAHAGTPITLDPALAEHVLKHVRPGTVDLPLQRVESMEASITSRQATPIRKQAVTTFETQPNGLIAEASRTRFFLSDAGRVDHVLSLCGFITLVSVNTDPQETNWAPVQDFSVFSPMGINPARAPNYFQRLLALQSDGMTLCNPVAGSEFQFSYEFERDIAATLLFPAKKMQVKREKRCKVATKLQPASKLEAGLRGDYLPVQCDWQISSDRTLREEWAFLKDSGIYLLLKTHPIATDATGAMIEYSEVVYRGGGGVPPSPLAPPLPPTPR